MEFAEKTAIITGAAAGIGRATVMQFLRGGANVVAVDINTDKLKALETELASEKLLTLCCDVSSEENVNATVAAAREKFGKIHILVNNAGVWRDVADFSQASTDLWRRYLDINLMGTVHFTKAVIDEMTENSYGRIINVASVAGVYGNAKMSFYSATKGAVISLTKALAKEVTGLGVTVNAVSPGSVSPAEQPDIDYTQPSTLSFAGRTGSCRENADLICFLASEKAGYISGQNIQIDGCRKKQ